MPQLEITVWYVLIASSVTALCTGLGIIPFLFVDRISDRFLGIGNSIAAGLMMGASIGLLFEAHLISDSKLLIGLAVGATLIIATRVLFPDDHEDDQP
jgi:zinc transporter ZupT